MANENNPFSIIKKGYIPDLEYCFDFLAKLTNRIQEACPSVVIMCSTRDMRRYVGNAMAFIIDDQFKIDAGVMTMDEGVPEAVVEIQKKIETEVRCESKYMKCTGIDNPTPHTFLSFGHLYIGRQYKAFEFIEFEGTAAFIKFIKDAAYAIVDELDPNDPVKIKDIS